MSLRSLFSGSRLSLPARARHRHDPSGCTLQPHCVVGGHCCGGLRRAQRATSTGCFVRIEEIKQRSRSRRSSRRRHRHHLDHFAFPRGRLSVDRPARQSLQSCQRACTEARRGAVLLEDGGFSRPRISRPWLSCADGSLPRPVFRQRVHPAAQPPPWEREN